jgi:hypothetical protein
MRSILSRVFVAGVVGVLAASAAAPASAATRHKRAPAQAETITQPVAVHPTQSNVPSVFQRGDCVSDEGYGRFSYCDQGSL